MVRWSADPLTFILFWALLVVCSWDDLSAAGWQAAPTIAKDSPLSHVLSDMIVIDRELGIACAMPRSLAPYDVRVARSSKRWRFVHSAGSNWAEHCKALGVPAQEPKPWQAHALAAQQQAWQLQDGKARLFLLTSDATGSTGAVGIWWHQSKAPAWLKGLEQLDAKGRTALQAACGANKIGRRDSDSVQPLGLARRRDGRWQQAWIWETDHYRIIGTAAGSSLQRVGKHLEAIYRHLQMLLPSTEPKVKFDIILSADIGDFTDLATPLFPQLAQQKKQSTLAGFYNSGARAVFTYAQKKSGTAGGMLVQTGHEAVHQYVRQVNGPIHFLPTWFDEGLAVHYEFGQVAISGDFQFKPPSYRLKLLRAVYAKQAPLTEFTTYAQPMPLRLSVHHYAEAYAMVHYQLDDPKRLRRLQQWWASLAKNPKNIGDQQWYLADGSIAQWQAAVMEHAGSGRLTKEPNAWP